MTCSAVAGTVDVCSHSALCRTPCLCRWVRDVCTGECQVVGNVLTMSEFGLLEVRCWQDF